ncbi:wd-40 repeat protein [Stylonychia lemnae]|uniref:Wd-40 repeat protein n=1 Tax=Stylonychia lemnae TaxID=5949 RepID=A0A078AMT5_STYLE|nr:wd-40 repeat protein [Stylonychia lemnae]|eukprot:CDW82687.1 wd-40 repeat protein [Stylonychia lemnae]
MLGTFKNVMFGPSDQIIFCQQLPIDHVKNKIELGNEYKSLVIFKCNYKKPEQKEHNQNDWLIGVQNIEEEQKPKEYNLPDEICKYLVGYPELELSDYFIDKFLFGTYNKSKTLLVYQMERLKKQVNLFLKKVLYLTVKNLQLLRFINNEKKKIVEIKLYNSTYEQEDNNVIQNIYQNFHADESFQVYSSDGLNYVYDINEQRIINTLPSHFKFNFGMFMKLGNIYYLVQNRLSNNLYLIKQDQSQEFNEITFKNGETYYNDIHQIISISDKEIKIMGLSDQKFEMLKINLTDYTAEITKLDENLRNYKKQVHKNESGEIFVISYAQKQVAIYSIKQRKNILQILRAEEQLVEDLAISFIQNAIFVLQEKNTIKAYNITTGESLKSLDKQFQITNQIVVSIKIIQDYLMIEKIGKRMTKELHEIKNGSFTSKQASNSLNLDYPLIQLCHVPQAKYIVIDKQNGMSFYHNQGDKRIALLKTYFTTDEYNQIKRVDEILNTDNPLNKISDISTYLKFYPGIGNILNIVALKPIFLEIISKKLQLMDKCDIPMILMKNQINGNSPIDIACQSNQLKSLNILFELLTKYQDDHGFNYLMDNQLIYLIKKGLNLQEYFESSLPKFQIISEQYPYQHSDAYQYIKGENNLSTPSDVKGKYEDIFTFENTLEESQTSIEYYLINLPETLQKLELIKALSITKNLDYFDNLTIQTIIQFKWREYTKTFFKLKFFIFSLFVFSLVFEIWYSNYKGKTQAQPSNDDKNIGITSYPDSRDLTLMIINKSICFTVLLCFFFYEVISSLGDYTIEDHQNQHSSLMIIITWTIWIIAVMTINIVFMNFIIAVIQDSYEKMMQRSVAQSYQVKAKLIKERELFMNPMKDDKNFPKYLILRRPIITFDDDSGEWQGFIKDLKYTIRTTTGKSKAEILQNLHSIQSKNNEGLDEKIRSLNQKLDQAQEISKNELQKQSKGVNELDVQVKRLDVQVKRLDAQGKGLDTKVDRLDVQVKGLDTKVNGLDTKVDGLDTKVDGLDTKVDSLGTSVLRIQDDMEFIKSSLTQLLQNQNQ